MHGYAFNIGDLLRIKPGTIDYITTPADPDKHYTHSLRVVFQFWDGKQNVYVVTAEDGITMFIIEDNAELQEAAPEEAQAPDTVNSRLLGERVEGNVLIAPQDPHLSDNQTRGLRCGDRSANVVRRLLPKGRKNGIIARKSECI